MNNLVAILSVVLYLALLFGVAYYAEYRLRKKKSLINNGYVYALSMAVYCTAWTYYGSVGRAAGSGIEFLAIYLGPTLAAALFIPVLHKIIRICKTQRINSIADLISTRYGKNFSIAVVVTILCVAGIIPYIALQLKAISSSIHTITGGTEVSLAGFLHDDSFYITLLLAAFIILFGTRSIDASEKHEGLVAAVAFESIIKLAAFLAAGLFVVYGIYNGFGDLFTKAAATAGTRDLFQLQGQSALSGWTGMLLVSLLAVFFLPRQFQVSVVENVQESHLKKATWLFPLYLLLINIFVLPIAFGGKLLFAGQAVDADTYVLALPLQQGHTALGLFVFIGGFSAATSMIIVETIALSTMMSNNLAAPVLLSAMRFRPAGDRLLSRPILQIRRFSILLILALAYIYDKTIAQHLSLVSIGLVSFVAVAQFAPAVIGGIYWKDASKNGAMAGICTGFAIWFFTLVVPSMVSAGLLNETVLREGLFGQSWLKPFSILGVEGMDSITHAAFWSLLANLLVFVVVSLYSRKKPQEIYQAEIFVDIFRHSGSPDSGAVWKGTAELPALRALLENFLGAERTHKILSGYAARHRIALDTRRADPRLVAFSEKVLSGVIGSASARIMVSSVTKEEELRIDEVLHMLRESQQLIGLNKELRKKSAELEKATEQLRHANNQLQEMDRHKDEFLYTVTHELRTPLTSIRAMAEIIHDHPGMKAEERQHFLAALIRETERLSHLITQVLNLEKYESGRQALNISSVQLNGLLRDALQSIKPLADEKQIRTELRIPDSMFIVQCDEHLMMQVLNNLLSNAVKFAPEKGLVRVSVHAHDRELELWVEDNGKGIEPALHELIFDKFFQAKNQTLRKPEGTGLGLAICRRIIELHDGRIWVESEPGKGSKFIFTLPLI